MSTTINGHTLTAAQHRTLSEARDYLLNNAGDSWAGPTSSPKGDGQAFSYYDIWGRSNQATAHRRNLFHLELLGVLRACEMELAGNMLRWKPWQAPPLTEQQRAMLDRPAGAATSV